MKMTENDFDLEILARGSFIDDLRSGGLDFTPLGIHS
jgi:hypothetical protein